MWGILLASALPTSPYLTITRLRAIYYSPIFLATRYERDIAKKARVPPQVP